MARKEEKVILTKVWKTKRGNLKTKKIKTNCTHCEYALVQIYADEGKTWEEIYDLCYYNRGAKELCKQVIELGYGDTIPGRTYQYYINETIVNSLYKIPKDRLQELRNGI